MASSITTEGTKYYAIIFGAGEQSLLIGLYMLILILGFVFNAAIVWVILGNSFMLFFHFQGLFF